MSLSPLSAMPCHTCVNSHMHPYTYAFTWHTQHKFRLYPCTYTNTYAFHTYILRHIYYITLIHSHIHRYVSLYMCRQRFTSFTGSGHTDTHHKRMLIFVFLAVSIVVSQFSTHYITRILQIQISQRYFNHLPIHI